MVDQSMKRILITAFAIGRLLAEQEKRSLRKAFKALL